MTIQLIPKSFRPFSVQIVVSFLVVVYIAINIFKIGGDAFVINLNNTIVNPIAIGVTLLSFTLARKFSIKGENHLLWLGLTIGWALWTVAELWWGIAAIIGQEVPYPSWADLFWIAGYIPMYIAIRERIHTLPQRNNPLQKAGTWFSILLSVGWTIGFVLIPIIQNNGSTAVLESILNILYPLVDLVLLIMVLQIFFTYQQGLSGRAWGWLSAGFIIHSLSSLIFSYASAIDLYYPNGQANLLSTLGVDVPYNLGYLFWIIGLLIVLTVQKRHQTFADAPLPLKLVPDTHLLIFTQKDDTVIDVSKNYLRMFPLKTVSGISISEALGIPPNDADRLLAEIKAKKILIEREILVNTNSGSRQALISGIPVVGPQGDHSGYDFLLRMLTGDYSLDELLTNYEKGMVRVLLSKTETKGKQDEEIKQLLSNYYLAYLKAYYNRSFSEGGSIMADAFLSELQSVAKLHEWKMEIRSDALLDTSFLSLSKTQEALPILAETAKQFVIRITDKATANILIQKVLSSFDKSALKNIYHFEKAEEEII